MAERSAESVEPDPVDVIVDQWRAERPDLDPSPIALFGRIHRIYLRYQSVITRAFAEHDLNPASFDVLAALRRAGSPYRKSSSELAKGSLLSSAGVTFRLDRLEQSGLIERHRDTEDRRVVHSQLTDKGLAAIEDAITGHLDNEHRMLRGLTQEECQQLSHLLSKLEASILAATDGQP